MEILWPSKGLRDGTCRPCALVLDTVPLVWQLPRSWWEASLCAITFASLQLKGQRANVQSLTNTVTTRATFHLCFPERPWPSGLHPLSWDQQVYSTSHSCGVVILNSIVVNNTQFEGQRVTPLLWRLFYLEEKMSRSTEEQRGRLRFHSDCRPYLWAETTTLVQGSPAWALLQKSPRKCGCGGWTLRAGQGVRWKPQTCWSFL